MLSLPLVEWLDAAIILVIAAGSGVLGFSQEFSASKASAELCSRLVRQVQVPRGGAKASATLHQVVFGDIALLGPGIWCPVMDASFRPGRLRSARRC